ncbi:bifunctional proline dehydrogenase/L-glutamate gamma-semialdehyde dehydrogenase PutA [Pseudomonas benzenivorans]|uniref:Bifunctional protein PutA n=1 Tax=Pseudomonas benzenivorans TaxID=556533 RepID=A0ABY5H726_9PSED|nr:bifunctional proline dehydrogenase/L-glutamate gamma-semialdehyde dehydrogenase PutA [Pseudomonas benzenivorans]UTW07869.1 bifunctional proline dehydrogenase/L-glutamate gamma-semialdehyde dehydrogenase PutA [Pseudomonas benzenivorans]
MSSETSPLQADALRREIDAHYRADETDCVTALLGQLDLSSEAQARIQDTAGWLVEGVRAHSKGGIDAFLHQYGLSTQEGVMLMCIAEALLRIPDDATQEALIRDKMSAANWDAHLGQSDSVFVNASTWALMLTGRVVGLRGVKGQTAGAVLRRLVARVGEPMIREAVNQAMRIMGKQFVMGRTIGEALERAKAFERKGYRYSYDMLGEAARTMADADRFFESYRSAIAAIGRVSGGKGIYEGPGISVKLSALHPRYELWQEQRVMDELVPRMHALALEAARLDIGLNIDAEEAARLDISLDVIEAVSGAEDLKGWDGFGVVVQAYQKRAPFVIDWLADMARRHGRRLMVRLVKGAYWDAEIKLSQELALPGYPVYTRKMNTDVAYLACARKLLANRDVFYPQFATHNAHSIASVLEYAGGEGGFEFQRLHGMGEELYEGVVEDKRIGMPCRIYAPVGGHEDLLAYLVRRLLENGANSSFVNRIQDESLPVEAIIADPVAQVQALSYIPHPHIPQPRDLYGPGRANFAGRDLFDRAALGELARSMAAADQDSWRAGPIIDGQERERDVRDVLSPADRGRIVGQASEATDEDVEQALASAQRHAADWAATPVAERAAALRRLAELMEEEAPQLMAMAVREAGKTLADALAEVREAVDFCRYYAQRAELDFGQPVRLRLPADAGREARLQGGGVFCCISPWNFPLAIFTGQITAALVAGNAVVAKPAEQTPLIAAAGVRLMHRAGIPAGVLHLLPGDGARVGGALVADARVSGVCFTGSTEVAQLINRTLARRDGALCPLIAETGGLNAMIVDSSALPEQVARDVVMSAFQSAGQRCSALRVLFVQEDVADKMLKMICGAMEELNVGDPAQLSTDIGPVIDDEAKGLLDRHIKRMRGEAKLLKQVKPGPSSGKGSFVGPIAFELDSISRLKREVFGPVLHVIRFPGEQIGKVVETINATGYGLTHGIHTRVDETRDLILDQVRAGNAYVNRNQIGAVVGVQPFGGEGLSGTGPKAGGPHYLQRFASEVVDGASLQTAVASGGETPVMAGVSRERLDRALRDARSAAEDWSALAVGERAALLEKAAAAIEASVQALGIHDPDGVQGIGRAAEALRFYAAQAEAELAEPVELPGPTGERNELRSPPRGLVVCLAAAGSGFAALAAQCGAALAAGNTVVLWHEVERVASELQRLLLEAGVPKEALGALATGDDATLKELVEDARVDAVALAGPHTLAKALNRTLAECDGAIRPLIPFALDGHADGAPGCPLAGSPAYLHRFVLERAVSIDTTASGGNASLFTME